MYSWESLKSELWEADRIPSSLNRQWRILFNKIWEWCREGGSHRLFSIFRIMAKSHQTQPSMLRVKYGCVYAIETQEEGNSILLSFASRMNFSQFSTLFARARLRITKYYIKGNGRSWLITPTNTWPQRSQNTELNFQLEANEKNFHVNSKLPSLVI